VDNVFRNGRELAGFLENQMEAHGGNNKPAPSWAIAIDLSRTGFAFWIWAEVIRSHDGPVLCLLGAALTLLQADTAHVLYRMFKEFKWSRAFSIGFWIILTAFTWGVVYHNSRS
jgi:hypothetical protein